MHFLKLLRDDHCDPFCSRAQKPQASLKNTQLLDSLQNFPLLCLCKVAIFFLYRKSKPFILLIWHNVIKSKEFLRKIIFHPFWWNSIFADVDGCDPRWSIKWLGTIWGSRNCEHHWAWFTMAECLLGFPPVDFHDTQHSFLIVFCRYLTNPHRNSSNPFWINVVSLCHIN